MRYDLPDTQPTITLIGPGDAGFWAALDTEPAGQHALVIGDPATPATAVVITGTLQHLACYLDPYRGPLSSRITALGARARQQLTPAGLDVVHPQPADEPRAPLDAMSANLITLAHSGLQVPHERLRVTSVQTLPTANGEAFTAVLRLDGTRVGTAENAGQGGATEFRFASPRQFGWRQMTAFVAECRHRGQPVSEEFVLDCLVEEHRLARSIARAAHTGATLVRLLNADGHLVADMDVHPAPVNAAERLGLARRLAAEQISRLGRVWQLWTGTGWKDLTPGHGNTATPAPQAASPTPTAIRPANARTAHQHELPVEGLPPLTVDHRIDLGRLLAGGGPRTTTTPRSPEPC